MVQVAAQLIAVPPEFLPFIETVHFNTGIPKSWLAAVCQMTGWDPSFRTLNIPEGSVRQFGIAGIWARIPEIIMPGPGECRAGWFGNAGFTGQCCFPGRHDGYNNYLTVLQNMTLAAQILKDCADTVEAVCGEVNALAFLRWQWGCKYFPLDPVTGLPQCSFPPGTPNIFIQETQDIIAAQTVFAETFQEPVFGAPPISVSLSASRTLVGPGGSVTFSANVSGGSAPYTFHWDFGDGQVADTNNPTISHTYPAEGVFLAVVAVKDRVGSVAQSGTLLITVAEGGPGGGLGMGLALLGLLGLVGLVGIAGAQGKGGGKRQRADQLRKEAQETRAKAQQLRQEGTKLRADGRQRDADRVEKQAADLERRSTELEDQGRQLDFEATREEAERARQQAGVR